MNIFFVVIDSLRQDHLGCYGNDWIQTPNMDKFASESVVFENMYPEALFTIPIRHNMMTGNFNLHNRGWSFLEETDIILPEVLDEANYLSAMITDMYHYFKPGANFHRGFNSWDYIRGQEADTWRLDPHDKNLEDYTKPEMKSEVIYRMIDQYLRNTQDFKTEEDYFGPQVFGKSIEFIERNAKLPEDLFMMIDCFDPHEPWDPPAPYDKLYCDPNYKGPKLIHPKYGPTDWLTEAELNDIKGRYAGEVTMVDVWFGKFIDKLAELNILDESLVILVSDHGHPHSDHGILMKNANHLYSETLKVPFMIRFPNKQYAGQRHDTITQFVDIPATILDIIGMPVVTEAMHGKSLMPVIKGEINDLREYATMGVFRYADRCIRDKNWSFIRRPEGQQNELYNLKEDPGELVNLIDKAPDEAKRMAKAMSPIYDLEGSKFLAFHMAGMLEGHKDRTRSIIAILK